MRVAFFFFLKGGGGDFAAVCGRGEKAELGGGLGERVEWDHVTSLPHTL